MNRLCSWLFALGALLLFTGYPCQLRAYWDLGEGWEPVNTRVVISGIGVGVFVIRQKDDALPEIVHGGLLGFKRL